MCLYSWDCAINDNKNDDGNEKHHIHTTSTDHIDTTSTDLELDMDLYIVNIKTPQYDDPYM